MYEWHSAHTHDHWQFYSKRYVCTCVSVTVYETCARESCSNSFYISFCVNSLRESVLRSAEEIFVTSQEKSDDDDDNEATLSVYIYYKFLISFLFRNIQNIYLYRRIQTQPHKSVLNIRCGCACVSSEREPTNEWVNVCLCVCVWNEEKRKSVQYSLFKIKYKFFSNENSSVTVSVVCVCLQFQLNRDKIGLEIAACENERVKKYKALKKINK